MMKKIISLIVIFTLATTMFLTGKVYAASLDRITVDVNKTTVRPGEDVTLTINFGQALGAYTFNISYDKNIFEYVSVNGGTANNTSDKVRVTFYDSTGGTSPRENMSIVFKAKADITTSNPTEFTVTGEGLANNDASVTYDDITTPMVKNITVEPEYQDYTINLAYTGEILVNQPKEMILSYSSPMGKYYEHARLIAEATTPEGASVQLKGINSTNQVTQDIIESGWGDPQGYSIGGKDVSQRLNVTGLFTKEGDYTITLKLIDRDNSDAIIAQNKFAYKIPNTTQKPAENETPKEEEPKEETPKEDEVKEDNKTEEKEPEKVKPNVLPKTGHNIYVPIIILIIALISGILYFKRKK